MKTQLPQLRKLRIEKNKTSSYTSRSKLSSFFLNMDEPNILNIPAFKRRRSIAARAKKTPSYLKQIQKSKKRKKRVSSRQTVSYTEPAVFSPFTDIPAKSQMPSEDLFQEPEKFIGSKNESRYREMKTCGICEGYFDNIEVAIIKITSPIRKGDTLIFEKQDGLFEQEASSIQINRKDITLATTGSEIGLKVIMEPLVGGQVYKLIT